MRDLPLVNVNLLASCMDERGLDGLLVRSGENITYLSGVQFPGTLGRHLDRTDTPRDVFAVFPREGDPIVIVSDIAAPIAELTSWSSVRAYRDYQQPPIAAVGEALVATGLARGRLGVDVPSLGARRWQELQEWLPDAELRDCSAMLDDVRAIKTPAEVEKLTHACAVLDEALGTVMPGIEEGETERSIHARVIAALTELGAQGSHGMLQTSSNPTLYGGESTTKVARGDHLRTDYVSYVDNYAANLSRVVVVGPRNDEILEQYETFRDLYWRAGELLRPGATAGQVFSGIRKLFRDIGWPHSLPILGHGVGPWFHQQPPIISEASPASLKSGMVIALEPASGNWHLQDEFLVGADGCTRLSDRIDLTEPIWTA